jgi:hypothetical protein
MVRDVERWRIPPGGAFTITDFLIDQPGVLRKRGAAEYQSGPVNVPGRITPLWVAVFCPEFPGPNGPQPRILGIASDGGQHRYLYDLTNDDETVEPGPALQIDVEPYENPSTFINADNTSMAIVTSGDPTVLVPPKKVTVDSGGAIEVADLGGGPPLAKVSSKHGNYFALANDGSDHRNRVWWSAGLNPEDWSFAWTTPGGSYFDLPQPIVAMTEFGGALLIWTRHAMYRILGDVPPAHPLHNMKLQPVNQIGCIDARSVVKTSQGVYFANEEGVFITDGATTNNVTLGKGFGITSLWREIMVGYSTKIGHVVAAGLFQDLFLIVTIIKGLDNVATLLCYLPSGGWTLLTNLCGGSMYANALATADDQNNLYCANIQHDSKNDIWMVKLANIFSPETGMYPNDADGTPIQPLWETRTLPGGSTTLKRFGYGHLIYQMQGGFPDGDPQGSQPYLRIWNQIGIADEGNWNGVHEGEPLRNTTPVGAYKRSRFRMFKNGMGLKIKVEQVWGSALTNINGFEYELGQFYTADTAGEGEGV